MSIDINKHEVDIDILKKQNENDLVSIKELYGKLKEMEKKISQIKYIDSNLADKLKKDYERLKKVILDENIQFQLSDRINEINSQLNNTINEVNSQLETNAEKISVLDEEFENFSNYVTPEMFGAVGDGVVDDTEAFVLAFKSGKNIVCKKEKTYYFSSIINVRSITRNITFNGNYATFINFRLEIALKDNEYDWRIAYSPNRIDFINCDFGVENDEREQSYNKPVVISGMTVTMSNIVLAGRLVLVAYPDRYVDAIHFNNVIKMNNETFSDDYNYNAIMRITRDGELVKTTSNGAGDSWLFIGCNEFRSNNKNGEERYGLVSLYNNTTTFIECIQSNVTIKSHTTTIFTACHWEASYINVEKGVNVLVKFDSCYFYGQAIPKAELNIIFENCMFRLGYGSKFNYRWDNSILKNSQVLNCRFCDNAGLIGNSSDLDIDIGCNYKGDSFEGYGNPPSIDINSEKTEGSFTGETIITFYGKRLEADYYNFKKETTLTLDGTQQIRLRAYCKSPMIFEFFIQNNGKIYKGTTKTIDSCDTLEIHVFNTFFRANTKYRREIIKKCYPPTDTLEVVETLPNYVENSTLYRLSKGLCIDTSDNPVTNVKRFAILNKSSVGTGDMW